jgi:DNA-binding response OmpR family regulator
LDSKRFAPADLLPVHRLSEHLRFGAVFAHEDASGTDKSQAKLPRIMVVEDDYLVASEIVGALADAGFDVVGTAGSAKEAMQIAAATRPVLAIMDVRLNGARDGIAAALELFEIHGIRSVFATAHQDAEARGRAKPANPLAWIPKPYSMATLIEVLRNALRDLQDEDDGGDMGQGR